MKFPKKEIGVLIGSILFAFLLCEALYRMYDFYYYGRQLNKFAKDQAILQLIPYDPVLQYALKPGGYFLLGGKIPYKINSAGFRDYDIPLDKGASRRIIILGDSNTFGWGIRMEDTFPKALERKLKDEGLNIQVMNAGVYGYNTRQEVLFLRHELLKYKPDTVIIAFHPNDTQVNGTFPNHPFIKNGESYYHSWFFEFLKSRINRFLNRNKRDSTWCTSKTGDFFPLKVKLANFCITYEQGFADDYPGWAKTKEALKEAKRLSQEHGFSLLLMILPDFSRDFANYGLEWVHEKVREFARNAGINALDVYPYFKGMDNTSLQNTELGDTHPNKRAHEIIAEALQARLRERGLLE